METPTEIPSDNETDGVESLKSSSTSSDHDLLAEEVQSLRESYQALQSKSSVFEADLLLLKRQKDEAVDQKADLSRVVDELSVERDSLRERVHELEVSLEDKEVGFMRKVDEELREKEELKNEVEVYRERIEKLEADREMKTGVLLESLDSISVIKKCLVKIIESLDDEKLTESVDHESGELELEEELKVVSEETMAVTRLASVLELKVSDYKEMRKKEKRELENSVVSLTEENRDINSLLRIALVEKDAVEKSLSRLKGGGEQKRVALLQIAERGLQRVGFGFMMGSGSIEQSSENSEINMGSKSDGSEYEEEIVSVASTVERIMKNLRLEITQLRRSLEESRSDTERLQSLTEKQAQTISENEIYIKELEDRERVLAQNVEELLIELKETEAEVVRWREACELEVEAGKNEIEERDKVVAILKQELEKTKAALEISNGKLKLKEDLVSAAMAAQAAAESSLQLADTRAAGLRERIEELTRQLEEAEGRERNNRHKVRHICWPWHILKMSTPNNPSNRIRDVRRTLPEMQALLHYNV